MKTAMILHSLFSEYTSEQLRQIMELAEKYGGKFRIVPTGIQIYDITMEDKKIMLEQLPEGISPVKHKAVNSVRCCRGTDGCEHAFQETISIGTHVDATYFGMAMPNKIRIGISGCPRSCAESYVSDIGLVGLPNGFSLVVGGSSGSNPKKAETLLQNLSREEALEKIEYLLQWYKENAKEKEKFEQILKRLGNPFSQT